MHKLLKYLMTVILAVLLNICIDNAIDDVKTDGTLFCGTWCLMKKGWSSWGHLEDLGFIDCRQKANSEL